MSVAEGVPRRPGFCIMGSEYDASKVHMMPSKKLCFPTLLHKLPSMTFREDRGGQRKHLTRFVSHACWLVNVVASLDLKMILTFHLLWITLTGAVEFLEHVGVNYHFNYITAFRKAAILIVTSSRWGGWHHVEVHDDPWWIRKYESYGFHYSEKLTQEVRSWARSENNIGPDGKKYRAQHIQLSAKVFLNPAVAALPEHAHLFPELGCYVKRGEDGVLVHRECGTGRDGHLESKLPDSFKPLELTPEMDEKWLEMMKSKLNLQKIA